MATCQCQSWTSHQCVQHSCLHWDMSLSFFFPATALQRDFLSPKKIIIQSDAITIYPLKCLSNVTLVLSKLFFCSWKGEGLFSAATRNRQKPSESNMHRAYIQLHSLCNNDNNSHNSNTNICKFIEITRLYHRLGGGMKNGGGWSWAKRQMSSKQETLSWWITWCEGS